MTHEWKEQTQTHIRKYINGGLLDDSPLQDQISPFSVRCLVGMFETGEAVWSDFDAVGGERLAEYIQKCKAYQSR